MFTVIRHPFTDVRFMIHKNTCSRARIGDWFGPFLDLAIAEKECTRIAEVHYKLDKMKINYCKRCNPRREIK